MFSLFHWRTPNYRIRLSSSPSGLIDLISLGWAIRQLQKLSLVLSQSYFCQGSFTHPWGRSSGCKPPHGEGCPGLGASAPRLLRKGASSSCVHCSHQEWQCRDWISPNKLGIIWAQEISGPFLEHDTTLLFSGLWQNLVALSVSDFYKFTRIYV